MSRPSRIRVLIADEMTELRSNVRRMLSNVENILIVGEAGDGEEALRLVGDVQPHVVLMDMTMPKLDGLKVTETLAKEKPEVQVVLMSVQSEQEYFRRAMKSGAKDFLTKPFSSGDLIETINNVFNKWIKDRPEFRQSQSEAQVFTFFSTKGGVGKTTLAANLAVHLAKAGKKTLLIDCSLQFGDVAVTLDLKPAKNISFVVGKTYEIPFDQIARNITPHSSGLSLLLAPTEPALAEAIQPHHLKSILEQVSAEYQYIIIDTAPKIGELELALFDHTNMVFLLATLEMSSLKNTKLCLKTLSDIHFDTAKIRLVLNKDIPNVGIAPQDIADKLGIPVFAVIPMDPETAQMALNTGEPFVVKFPQSSLSRAIEDLATKILPRSEPPKAPAAKGSAILRIKDILFGSGT